MFLKFAKLILKIGKFEKEVPIGKWIGRHIERGVPFNHRTSDWPFEVVHNVAGHGVPT